MRLPMKFMHLLMFGTVMFMANGAGAQNSVKPFHLDEATISDVHAAYRSGALTSVGLVQAYLERIRACDQAGPKLNVVIFLNPRALEEAAALDEHFRRTGKFVGPLHGIPLLLKDNVNTNDMPTTGGSLSLAGYTPVTEAAITRKCPQGTPSHPLSACSRLPPSHVPSESSALQSSRPPMPNHPAATVGLTAERRLATSQAPRPQPLL